MNTATNIRLAAGVMMLCLATVSGCVSEGSSTRRTTITEDAADQNYQLGARYYRSGNYELARDRLERAIEFDSRMVDAHNLLALTMVQLGQDRLATESFNRAVRLAPNNPDVRNAYAIYLCQKEEYDEAVVQFERAIGIIENEETYLMMTNAGVCVSKKPDPAMAEKYFRDALRVRPTHPEALIQMAALQYSNEDFLRARAFLERFLSANPPTPAVLYLAVQIETQDGDNRAATDYTNQLIREFPESAEARILLRQGE
ncbi:MAG: type IV pilus biogenesis/stability protein PilW [Woeseiaceae bacterium]